MAAARKIHVIKYAVTTQVYTSNGIKNLNFFGKKMGDEA